jgi:septal ring-binding cell division protein DamX
MKNKKRNNHSVSLSLTITVNGDEVSACIEAPVFSQKMMKKEIIANAIQDWRNEAIFSSISIDEKAQRCLVQVDTELAKTIEEGVPWNIFTNLIPMMSTVKPPTTAPETVIPIVAESETVATEQESTTEVVAADASEEPAKTKAKAKKAPAKKKAAPKKKKAATAKEVAQPAVAAEEDHEYEGDYSAFGLLD